MFRFCLFIFRQRGREGEREGEKYQCVVASHTTQPQTWPTTQACALTGNRTSDLSVLRPVLYSLSHSSQGCKVLLALYCFCISDVCAHTQCLASGNSEVSPTNPEGKEKFCLLPNFKGTSHPTRRTASVLQFGEERGGFGELFFWPPAL